jgi:hypothetical protein
MEEKTNCNEAKGLRDLRIKDYGDAFSEYEKTLRTWFIAYGIGGPVLFLTQPYLRAKLVADHNARCIAVFFLLGILCQVIESILYKAITWYPYYRIIENISSAEGNKWYYKVSDYVHKHYWIDFVFDILTFAVFAYATYLVLPIIELVWQNWTGA